ncbi:MAG: hypothetical protein LKM32_13880 [Chiayiivirga sp.]|jgi:outer membrane lipoprotein-sorting protein|uniref:hypothetical protein n=1 Tax=Chiayiivirga sp. TaxID=2041042 RepID=UPI0025BC1B6D|nr:hypothetical protein [Chiayiivirga sp.]MCI1730419.1 hypothetical protein [Chiayiivirga sp.]
MKSISLMAVLLVAAGTVQADAREEVMQAYEKAMAEESYRVQSRSEHRGRTQQSTIDIQPPDRFHMRSPESEVIVLPGGTWMNQGGQWMKLPMDMSSMIKSLTLSAMRDGANSVQDVREIGSGSVNGCDATTYAYRAEAKVMGVAAAADVELSICSTSGLPTRVVSTDSKSKSRSVIDYDFDAAIDIRAPN